MSARWMGMGDGLIYVKCTVKEINVLLSLILFEEITLFHIDIPFGSVRGRGFEPLVGWFQTSVNAQTWNLVKRGSAFFLLLLSFFLKSSWRQHPVSTVVNVNCKRSAVVWVKHICFETQQKCAATNHFWFLFVQASRLKSN